ncbi:MAG: hypothetical protein SGI88_19210 [Candidatus Hydrogenedentes bacterium]|nr:hypothetical protein [Candidatus Hydrogenedentota bacterium]
MGLASCARCKKLFLKVRANVCLACEAEDEAFYERLRQHIGIHPNQTAEEVSEATGIEIETVLRFINEGRIEVQGSTKVACGKCGKPAISAAKKLCANCLQKLNTELARQQARIVMLAQKKTGPNEALNTYKER